MSDRSKGSWIYLAGVALFLALALMAIVSALSWYDAELETFADHALWWAGQVWLWLFAVQAIFGAVALIFSWVTDDD